MFYFCAVKKSLIILTLFLLFKPFLPIVEYVVNYEYISKVLCVNKATPIMGCDGKCYLIGQLAKSSENEKPISDKKIIVKQIEILFLEEIKPIVFIKTLVFHKSNQNFNYCNLYNYLNSSSPFHPPSFIV
jgi:hypothetical protein